MIQGIGWFFFGVIISAVSYYTIPPLLEAIQTATSNSDPLLEAIFWIGLVSLWVTSLIIVPAYKIVKSLKTPS